MSTRDWKSSRLGLNVTEQPKSKQRVVARCNSCSAEQSVVFAELVRSVNIQAEYGAESYLCKRCFHKLPAYVSASRERSLAVRDKIVSGASERSKKLWLDPKYRNKCLENSKRLSKSKDFKDKVSKSIKAKFKDAEYAEKVRAARKQYWQQGEYRAKRVIKVAEFIEVSSDHREITDWLRTLGDWEIRTNDCSVLPSGLEIDVFLPSKSFGIEYHGGFWHSYGQLESNAQRTKHFRKASEAEAIGLTLLQVFDTEWKAKRPIVKSIILSKLGLTHRIYARDCEVVELDESTAKWFFDSNHLQRHRPAAWCFGLANHGVLVGAISLSRHIQYGHELIRFACVRGYTVVGGLSKLLCSAAKKLKIVSLFTYADRRYSSGRGYIVVGFERLGVTKPGYYYWRNNKLLNRYQFQKDGLASKLELFDPGKTEAENMFANGFRRIWDAGHHRLVKRFG